jgi:hypothetical protein
MAVFTGTVGNDIFFGTNDDDVFTAGGGGNDQFIGQDGNDRYVIDRAAGELFFGGTVSINDSGSELNVDTVDITDFVLAAGTSSLGYSAEDGGDTLRIASGFNELFLRNQLRDDSAVIETITYAGKNLQVGLLDSVAEFEAAINDLVAATDRAPFQLVEAAFALNEDSPADAINLGGVVFDQDQDPITFTLKSKPNFGEAILDGSELRFDPGADNAGETTLLLEARSGGAKPLKFTVPISVTAVNDAPVAGDDVATLPAADGFVVIDVLRNDRDVDGDAITVTSVFGRNNVAIQSDGTLLYTRDETLNSPDSFLYEIKDALGAAATGSVTVTVVSVDAPAANDDQFVLTEAKLLKGSRLDVLKNDNSPLGKKGIDRESLTMVDGPDEGALTESKGKLVYRADSSFDGQDVFTYTVADTAGRVSDVATVLISGPDLTI